MAKIKLKRADAVRTKLTKEELKRINQLYQDLYRSVQGQIAKFEQSAGVSASLRKTQLEQLKFILAERISQVNKELENVYKNSMKEMASAVSDDMADFLKAQGLIEVSTFFANVPNDVVNMILTGDIYNQKWALSNSIWKHTEKAKDDIYKIVAEGVAGNKDTLSIARDLEKYVNPSARKPWDWNKVYPGVNTKIDYNAQRLARTLVAHAYQEAIIRTTKNNPFISGIEWHSALIPGRTCQLCRDRDGKVYTPDTLPLDHPNGLCTMIPVTLPLSQVGDRLAAWAHGKKDPSIDRFAQTLVGTGNTESTSKRFMECISLII